MPAVLDLLMRKSRRCSLEDMIRTGYQGVICVEAGGPTPGLDVQEEELSQHLKS